MLAHNLILLAPPPLIDVLFARMRDLLPQTVPVSKGSKASGQLKGINRRFRIYRYGLSSVYRPHVDGAVRRLFQIVPLKNPSKVHVN